MTTTVKVTVRSPAGIEVLALLCPLTSDGIVDHMHPLASHKCHADNTEEVCEFAIYDRVALVVVELMPAAAPNPPPTPEEAAALTELAQAAAMQVSVEETQAALAAQASQGSETPATPAPLSEGAEQPAPAPAPADAPAPAPAPNPPKSTKKAKAAK